MSLQPLDLLVLALATWRMAYLMAKEDAPFGVMDKLRTRMVKDRTKPSVLTCIYCSSIWAALAVLLLWLIPPLQPMVWVLALSGGALMLGNYTGSSQQ